MDNKEFFKELTERLNSIGFKERQKEPSEKFYYDTDYSTLNTMHHAEAYDIDGYKRWIRIPYNEELFMEIFIMAYDKLHFHANPDVDINSIALHLLFVNSNDKHGWHTITCEELNSSDLKVDDSRYADYLREDIKADVYYKPTEELIDYIVNTCQKCDIWLNKDHGEAFVHIQEEESTEGKRKAFKQYLENSFKEMFKDKC